MNDSPVRLLTDGRAQPPRPWGQPDQNADSPLVSCLMVTGSRPHRARLAIECFTRQTYESRELVIVDDGPDDELAHHVQRLSDDRIRMVRLQSRNQTLGELRNLAVEHARGEFVCQWDDDDLFDPDRLLWQVGLIESLELDACFLERWTMVWTAVPRVAVATRRLWEGSMVARRAGLPAYPGIRRGEDTPVAESVATQGRVALLDRPDLYVYLVHGANTFPESHFADHWTAASERFTDTDAALTRLQARVPIREAIAVAEGDH